MPMTYKVRLCEAGVHLFDRASGINVLLDDVDVPADQLSQAPRYLSVALTNCASFTALTATRPSVRQRSTSTVWLVGR